MSLLVFISIFIFAPISTLAAPSQLVIDEFSVASKSSAYDEYFRITNYSSDTYPLTGIMLKKITFGGTKYDLTTFTSDLDAGESVVVSHAKASMAADAEYTYSNTSFVKDSAVYIYNPTTKSIIDLVSFGNATEAYSEGAALDNPEVGDIYTRTNGLDSDDNESDFTLRVVPIIIDPNVARLVISELVPSPASGEEWFELYNPTNLDISLANIQICDALGAVECYPFDVFDIIKGGAYKTYGHAVTGITLNNTGDWLILYDAFDNPLTDSGGDYGAADKGVSLSVFGDQYRWTGTLTPGATNVFTDTAEVEDEPTTAKKSKVAKPRVVTASKKSVSSKAAAVTSSEEVDRDNATVKGAKSDNITSQLQKVLVSKKVIGYALIGLAILLVLGYTLWYFRDYAKEIYHKIRPGDDSARF